MGGIGGTEPEAVFAAPSLFRVGGSVVVAGQVQEFFGRRCRHPALHHINRRRGRRGLRQPNVIVLVYRACLAASGSHMIRAEV